jgi:hypothetical protein
MHLADLTEEDRQVIFACLKCVASGSVIPHDSEFQTIFGIEVSELTTIVEAWPNVDDSNDVVNLAINNSMVNLLGYPHGRDHEWEKYMPILLSEIARIFDKWHGEQVRGYFDGIK